MIQQWAYFFRGIICCNPVLHFQVLILSHNQILIIFISIQEAGYDSVAVKLTAQKYKN